LCIWISEADNSTCLGTVQAVVGGNEKQQAIIEKEKEPAWEKAAPGPIQKRADSMEMKWHLFLQERRCGGLDCVGTKIQCAMSRVL
jgi:hypothetical protein